MLALAISINMIGASFVFASTPQQTSQVAESKPVIRIITEVSELDNIIQPMDIPVDWTENTRQRLYTSTKFKIATAGAIITVLISKFGGKNADWAKCASAILTAYFSIEGQTGYEIVYYYAIFRNLLTILNRLLMYIQTVEELTKLHHQGVII